LHQNSSFAETSLCCARPWKAYSRLSAKICSEESPCSKPHRLESTRLQQGAANRYENPVLGPAGPQPNLGHIIVSSSREKVHDATGTTPSRLVDSQLLVRPETHGEPWLSYAQAFKLYGLRPDRLASYPNWLASHVRAKSQSRFSVATEILRASAASISLRPPKKRSSITWAARSSSACSRVSA
jgi:hypothetical protein